MNEILSKKRKAEKTKIVSDQKVDNTPSFLNDSTYSQGYVYDTNDTRREASKKCKRTFGPEVFEMSSESYDTYIEQKELEARSKIHFA